MLVMYISKSKQLPGLDIRAPKTKAITSHAMQDAKTKSTVSSLSYNAYTVTYR